MEDHVKGGRLKRMAKFALVTARTTTDLVAARAVQKLQGTDDGRLGEALKPTATRMVEVLGEMKGAATKLGQFISLVDQDTFPEEARRVLNRLLSQTPQRMTPEQMRQVVQAELGAAPESLFATFEAEPFAAASMGQVHAATLADGRQMAVKVQFPGVGKAIDADMRNAAVMARGLSLAGGIFDGREYFDEVAATLRRELDYRQEALQLEAYADALQPWPELVVPKVHHELSTGKVLCMERLHGPTLLEFAEHPANDDAARLRVASQLVSAIWGPFLTVGLIHADPHPGNYIVLDDDRLGVLDFGATKQLSIPFSLAYWQFVTASLRLDDQDVYDTLAPVGFSFGEDIERTRVWVNGLRDIVERPVRNDFYDWGACRLAIDCRAHYLAEAGTAIRVRGPAESLMFYRAAAGAGGDFRILRAKGDFRSVLHGLLQTAWQATSPEMKSALQAAGVWVIDELPPAGANKTERSGS